MLNRIKNKYMTILSVVMLSLSLFSCEEDEEVVKQPGQMFRPVRFSVLETLPGQVTFSWIPIKDANFLLEISRDDHAFEVDLKTQALDAGTKEYTITDIWGEVRYSARIKSVSNNPEVKDSEYSVLSFVSAAENIVRSCASAENWITIEWDAAIPLTHIKVTGGAETTIQLTASEIASGQKKIEGLTPGATYTFTLYQGERNRGTVSVTMVTNS
ncbi:MAG: hypothetical protein LBU22_03340 [Dysgonamonadaceae bacterium]|jgi:hypothetical protein|nr:hypothetical protein [Dysgonamonadaceae bacterium]